MVSKKDQINNKKTYLGPKKRPTHRLGQLYGLPVEEGGFLSKEVVGADVCPGSSECVLNTNETQARDKGCKLGKRGPEVRAVSWVFLTSS